MKKSINIEEYKQLSDAENIEQIICLAVLISAGTLLPEDNVANATKYFKDVLRSDCGNCSCFEYCLDRTINE